jgi:hypothetical protein
MPGGLMSLHGYTTKWGFFSGTCDGARALPFELSCDLVKGYIVRAQSALAGVEAEQAALRTPATEPFTWVVRWQEGDRYTKGGHKWSRVPVTAETVNYDGGSYQRFYFERERSTGNTREEIHGSARYGDDTLLNVCTFHNSKRADYLERDARNLRNYIAWQTERVNTWKPAPLLPVSHKDKLGFTPEEAPY